MPTKYLDRLKLPMSGENDIRFTTHNGLAVAKGYQRVIEALKGPLVEFRPDQLIMENLQIPPQQQWRVQHPASAYIEYRSKDYCNVKFMRVKNKDFGKDMTEGMFYASTFDLKSDKYPVLIDVLRRRRSLSA
jgi:hypothetical protein